MLLMHNLDVHRKAGIARRKISSFLSSLLENETLYSSDSECEYRITTTVRRVAKIKPDIQAIHGSDDDSRTSGRITRSAGLIANVKRETFEIDKGDGSVVNSILSCHVCGFVAVTELILQQHINNDHGTVNKNEEISFEFGDDNLNLETNYRVACVESTKRVRSKKFSCDVCTKHFKQKATLAKHMKLHYPIEDQYDQNDISDEYDTEDSDVIDSKAKATSGFPCNLCGKICESKDHILEHFKTFHPHDDDALSVVVDVINKHEGIGFPCTNCPTVYSNHDGLRRHLRKAHQIPNKDSKTNQYTCDLCSKVFYRPKCFATHLKKHNETMVEKRRTKNPKKKTHLCSFCGKSYPGSNHLKIHLRIHTGKRKTCTILDCTLIDVNFFFFFYYRRASVFVPIL